jgi:uncharacterized membrane protein
MIQSGHSAQTVSVSFFAALCLFLSAVEYAVPKPLPFMRLGLANLPILLSLAKMRKRDTLLLIVLKVLGQALISGTLFSYVFVFSAAGSFASGLTMLVLYTLFRRTSSLSNLGLSVAGALANNCAQVAAARVMVFGENAKYIAPVLFATGLATGILLGLFANAFCAESQWYKNIAPSAGDSAQQKTHANPGLSAASSVQEQSAPENTVSSVQPNHAAGVLSARIEFAAAMILFPVFLLQKNTIVVWCCTVVFFGMTMIKKHGKVKVLPSVFMTLFVTFFALLSPYGKVIFSIGAFHITQDALLIGLHRSGILTGMVFLSQFAISPRMELPGKAGVFLQNMFTIFDSLTAKRISFRRGHVIESLDARLSELWTGA